MFASGYDLLMALWGLVFVLGTAGFILGMNRVFQTEARQQDDAVHSDGNGH